MWMICALSAGFVDFLLLPTSSSPRQLLLQNEDRCYEIYPVKRFMFEIYPAGLFQLKCGIQGCVFVPRLQYLT